MYTEKAFSSFRENYLFQMPKKMLLKKIPERALMQREVRFALVIV